MRATAGFRKNYFTLASIQAFSIAPVLHAQKTAYEQTLMNTTLQYSSEEEDPPEDELLAMEPQNSKPCYCSQYFTYFTRLALLLNHFIPRCPYYTTYYAFRRTGVHPPKLSFF
jgi:hypothetical protein